jgi:hypothetical protein
MKTIITTIIALAIGFGIAWTVLPETRMTMTRSDTEKAPVGDTTAVQNKFFAFADTFTKNRDMGTPVVLSFDPELNVMVFRYGTSQESSQFGVYNYTTDELFTGIGNINYIEVQQFVSLLGNNQLLIWSSPGVDALATDKPKLVIKDFTNTTIKEIPLPATILSHFHQSHGYDSVAGKLYITVKDTFDHTPTTKYETYIFDEETHTLVKQEVKG